MNTGYIKVHRAICHHWLWDNPKNLRAWLYLLLAAAWEPTEIQWGKTTLKIQRGQLVTTIRRLSRAWGYYSDATQSLLNVFVRDGMIEKFASASMTIITIVNYDQYQLEKLHKICNKNRQNNKQSGQDSVQESVRKSVHIKEYKEEKEEKNNILSHTYAREEDFAKECVASAPFFEQCSMSLSIPLADVKKYFEQFRQEMLAQEKLHSSCGDYKQHFFNWMKKQKQSISNGNKSENRHEARRGTDVGNHTADDYGGSF